jgi:hypothetical protein
MKTENVTTVRIEACLVDGEDDSKKIDLILSATISRLEFGVMAPVIGFLLTEQKNSVCEQLYGVKYGKVDQCILQVDTENLLHLAAILNTYR